MRQTRAGNSGWQLMPVPTAVPPMASSPSAATAFRARSPPLRTWAA